MSSYYSQNGSPLEQVWKPTSSINTTPVNEPVDDERYVMAMVRPDRDFGGWDGGIKESFSCFQGANIEL